MMKKNVTYGLLLGLVALVIVGFVAGCGGKYSDVIKVNKQFIAVMEEFAAVMDTVKNADDASAALNKMADAMEKLAPEIKALNEKYPELQTQEDIPKELQAVQREAEAAGRRYASSVMRLMPYMTAPQVQEAQRRVAKAMSQMQ